MTDTDDMVDVTQGELQQLIGENRAGVGKAKQRVIGKDGAEPHGSGMEDGFVAEAAQALMAMDDLDLFADDDIAEDGEEGEDGGHGRLAVDDEKGDMVDFEAVGEISHACPSFVGVGHNDHLVAAIDQFGRQLIDVTFNSAYTSQLDTEIRRKQTKAHANLVGGRRSH
jgi:hypothetical protein